MRIHAIVGSRWWSDRVAVERVVEDLLFDEHVISGGAPGPDTWAIDRAKRRGLSTEVLKPDWARYSEWTAPLERNTLIASRCDCMTAFINLDSPTRGTRDAVMKALALGKFVRIVTKLDVANVTREPKYDTLARYLTERRPAAVAR